MYYSYNHVKIRKMGFGQIKKHAYDVKRTVWIQIQILWPRTIAFSSVFITA